MAQCITQDDAGLVAAIRKMSQITVRGTGMLDHETHDFKFTRVLRDRGDFSLAELEAWIVDMLKMLLGT